MSASKTAVWCVNVYCVPTRTFLKSNSDYFAKASKVLISEKPKFSRHSLEKNNVMEKINMTSDDLNFSSTVYLFTFIPPPLPTQTIIFAK